MPSASQQHACLKRARPAPPNNKRRPPAQSRTCRRCSPRRTSHTRNMRRRIQRFPTEPRQGIRMISSLPYSPNPTRERPVQPIGRPECPPGTAAAATTHRRTCGDSLFSYRGIRRSSLAAPPLTPPQGLLPSEYAAAPCGEQTTGDGERKHHRHRAEDAGTGLAEGTHQGAAQPGLPGLVTSLVTSLRRNHDVACTVAGETELGRDLRAGLLAGDGQRVGRCARVEALDAVKVDGRGLTGGDAHSGDRGVIVR